MNSCAAPEQQAIIHIIVVGFHHKKGCQVEFSYPPLVEGDGQNSTNLPDEWKCLPFLALPDGAHNYDADTIYFHLPPRSHYKSQTTVYGVSCYRQISTHLLLRKDADVTRETVQKSVVVLSQLPIYGILHAKLNMITQAYFDEKDFAKNEILKELFTHMNLSIKGMDESKKYLGFSSRSLVLQFHHKILVLFKLILLERRILFYSSPVQKLVGGIMSLLSLFPDMIEKGLAQCTLTHKEYFEMLKNRKSDAKSLSESDKPTSGSEAVNLENDSSQTVTDPSNSLLKSDFSQASSSPSSAVTDNDKDTGRLPNEKSGENNQFSIEEKSVAVRQSNGITSITQEEVRLEQCAIEKPENLPKTQEEQVSCSSDGIVLSSLHHKQAGPTWQTSSTIWESTSEVALNIASTVTSKLENLSSTLAATVYNDEVVNDNFDAISEIEDDEEEYKLQSGFKNSKLELKSDSPAKHESNSTPAVQEPPELPARSESFKEEDLKPGLETNSCGFPLCVFTNGYLCYPYVALQQFSDLTVNSERGYLIGATNILFKTQSHLADVVVDIENALLEIRDVNLKRQLHLSAADLRFAENLVNTVNASSGLENDIFWDGTGWEGGDEWIQAQFYDYLTSMLSISTARDANPKDIHDFNENFLAAWKSTNNYRVWHANEHKGIDSVNPAHPWQAQYSVNDVRLRLHHSLQSTDRGRKLEGAVNSANQAVVNTGKYMGTALVSAKSSVSSWWSSKMKKEP